MLAVICQSLRRQSRRGVTAIEYGLIAAAIIVAIIGVLRVTGTDLEAVFGRVGNGMAGVTKAASQIVFGTFEVVTGPNVGACSGYNFSGFVGNGEVIFLDTCDNLTQSTTYNDMINKASDANGSSVLISSLDSGQPITVPALQGPGTGFTIPADGYVHLYKIQSGARHSFQINNYNGGFTTSTLASAKAACEAEGGTLSGNNSVQNCIGGTLYTGTQIASALPPQ